MGAAIQVSLEATEAGRIRYQLFAGPRALMGPMWVAPGDPGYDACLQLNRLIEEGGTEEEEAAAIADLVRVSLERNEGVQRDGSTRLIRRQQQLRRMDGKEAEEGDRIRHSG